MRRLGILCLILITSISGIFALDSASDYYEKWRDGINSSKPGYVYDLEMPDKVYLSRIGYHDADTSKKPNVKDKSEYASEVGALVFMAANGKPSDFPPGMEYAASCDEAMGYGMMLAVLEGDKATFDKLAVTAEYYRALKTDSNYLTSWVIPVKKSKENSQEYEKFKKAVKDKEDDGWDFNNDVLDLWLHKKGPKFNSKGQMVGQKRETGSKATVSSIATDGSLDIAFAFLMAHNKWNKANPKKGKINYLGIAGRRYKQLAGVFVKYGNDNGFLPVGDYSVSVTRPCDWLLTHLRAYYELSTDEGIKELIGTLENQFDDFDKINGSTGFVPDFANTKGKTLVPEPDALGEANTEHFAINAARFPFRLALDYQLYGDRNSLNRSLEIVDYISKIKHDFDPKKEWWQHTNPFSAVRDLKGDTVKPQWYNYGNQVLKAGILASIHIAENAGINKYDKFYKTWYKDSAPDGSSFTVFTSQWNGYEDKQVAEKNGKEKTFTLNIGADPMHTGYFEDTWTLLALYVIEDKWKTPHGYDNEIDVKNWKASSSDISVSNDGKILTIKANKDISEEVSISREFKCKTNSGYSLMFAIERQNCSSDTTINGTFSTDKGKKESHMKRPIIVEHSNVSRSEMGGYDKLEKKCKNDKKVKLELFFKGGLKKDSVLKISHLGFYDPEVSPGQFRYVGKWDSNKESYSKGDYVRHGFETYECIKDHLTTRSTVPGQNFTVWKISDYTLVGERWKAGTYYLDGDLVSYQGRTYMARYSFLSYYIPPESPNNWLLYYDPFQNQVIDWVSDGSYFEGDIVFYKGNFFKCTQSHTANVGWAPDYAYTLWEKVNGDFNNIDPATEWETWTYYETGQVVTHNNKKFECRIGHTSQPGWEPGNVPAVWLEK